MGAAGLILTQIMCVAMNRSLLNVLVGGFGSNEGVDLGDQEYHSVTSCGAEEAAMVLDAAESVIIIPGYGLAVAQAQHTCREHRDGHLEAGMEAGMQHTFDRLQVLLAEQGSVAGRYRRVAAGFTAVAAAVPFDGWQRPAPCVGWVARDIVRHLVEWVPPFLQAGAGCDLGPLPSVADSPSAAWARASATTSKP